MATNESHAEISRDRLLNEITSERIVVVEAGAGYGKSVLSEQLCHRLGWPTVRLRLSPADRDPDVMRDALVMALRRARLSDLATAAAAETSLLGALEMFADASERASDPTFVLVDDAHHASSGDCAGFLVRLAEEFGAANRVGVFSRRLPSGSEALRNMSGSIHVTTADLAFSLAETAELLRVRYGLSLRPQSLERLHRGTEGWPAAISLWAARLGKTDNPELLIEQNANLDPGLASLVDGLLADSEESLRDTAGQLAHLPLLSERICGEVTKQPGVLGKLVASGLPIVDTGRGFTRFADPIAECLIASHPLRPTTAIRAAEIYATIGEEPAAMRTLTSAGLHTEAAKLLGSIEPQRTVSIGPGVVRSLAGLVSSKALDADPDALLQVARACDIDRQWRQRGLVLSRAEQSAEHLCDARLIRRVRAERAVDQLRSGDLAGSRSLAASVLAAADSDEDATRSRSLLCLGRIGELEALTDDDHGRACDALREAAECARRDNDDHWTAGTLLHLAEDGYREQCHYEDALAAIQQALDLPRNSPRERVMGLIWLADTLVEVGRIEEATVALRESRRLSELLGADDVLGYTAWSDALLAAQIEDEDLLFEALARCEAHKGDWYESYAGVGYLTDIADAFDRLGLREQADGYLSIARQRRADDERQFAVFEAGITARSGDPSQGRYLISAVLKTPGMSPRRRWRLQLLDAHAAARLDDPAASRLAAAAFDYCAQLGFPTMPIVRERRVAEGLVELAVAFGSLGALQITRAAKQCKVVLLGEFSLTRAGRSIALPAGRPAEAMMLIALRGRRGIHSEELIDLLWSDGDLAAGRVRLRNVLSRIRSAAGELVLREGELVRISEAVEVDAVVFEKEAKAALASLDGDRSGALASARSAAGRYRGPLLPEVPFAVWAADERERLRSLHLKVLDLLASDAERRDQFDEAVRLLEQAIDIEPYDEDRYIRAARLLASQHRMGSARTLLGRVATALGELGLAPSLTLDDLIAERALAAQRDDSS